MARRLGDQLLADIAKAQAEAAAATTGASAASPQEPVASPEIPTSFRKKQDAALLTIKGILAFASKHPILGSTMSATHLTGPAGGNLMDVFNRCVSSSTISKPLARALTEIVLALAKSDALFGSLRNSDAPSIQLDKGKRKRDQEDEGGRFPEHPQKRITVTVPIDQPDLLSQIAEAIRVVTHSLTNRSDTAQGQSINSSVISSIQLQLHQLFLFAVTSAPRAGDGRMQALQELAGLVQMLGVLSGIHIGNAPPPWHGPPGSAPPLPPPPPDIGTAVYPCLVPGCPKTFHRLYSLRAHQRLHTLEHRPYRCMQCPASFVRNHDLKRHALLHEKKAWRCAGCNKIFSRRDAIKRHKDARGRASATGGKSRSGEADSTVDAACAYAEIEEVEVDKMEGEEEISRRAKLWNGIAASSAGSTMAEHMGPEEGEVDPAIIYQAQHMVLGIHGLLQAEVAKGLGTPAAPAPMPPPHVSQSTLASIIARAQQSAVPADTVGQPNSPSVVPPAEDTPMESTPPPLSLSWLSEEQTRLLEQAIAHAASAAQAQAEAEAALEEEGEEFDEDEEEAEEQDGVEKE
ncbi:hypothetical protein BD309DRAFT_859702 [Dichomitus squalens]|uniref:Uncharacterized protein n=2 Tax=Dichomitus squalens TaxID=114155 RepID=A0A4Q9NV97_9APHY|nr:uncharacterized protein DICSQDRAFT_63573 [Dichomitus squalens LYAD-421 SS1]EJF60118.1 hypothetical protein DICSQDRAFT_63573 [Dichomitus squalens LYAD-421 SS1]TBU45679.1 hypothetical protein BD309DRAFT_859702 [Dichomitus squalens]TBU59895.1 hypothetical protein BD310DRAFT_816248 [Dichomitus squalens]